MKYTEPSFSVNPSSAKAPKDCRHGWIDARGHCVLCGESNPVKTLRGQIIRKGEVTTRIPPTDWHSGGTVTKGPGYSHTALDMLAKP